MLCFNISKTLINYNAFRVLAHKLFYPILTGIFSRTLEMDHFEETLKQMNRSVPFKVALDLGVKEENSVNYGSFPETLRQNQVVNNVLTAGRYNIHNSGSCASSGGFSETAPMSVDRHVGSSRKNLQHIQESL